MKIAKGRKDCCLFRELRRSEMSEPARVCQFFLRGRCQRQNCEFLHPKDLPERDREREREREKERERERERARERDREKERERDRDRRVYERPTVPPNIDAPCKYFLGSGCKFGVTCRFKHDTEKRERERRRSPGRVRERSRERSRERRRVRRDDSDDESILKGGDSSDDEDVEKKIALVKKKNADLRDDKDRKAEVGKKDGSKSNGRKSNKNVEKSSNQVESVTVKAERELKERLIAKKNLVCSKYGSTRKSVSPRKERRESPKTEPKSQSRSRSGSRPGSPNVSPGSPSPGSRCTMCGQRVPKRRAKI